MLLLVSPSPKQKVAAAHEACKDSQVWQCSDLFTLPKKKKTLACWMPAYSS